MELLRRQHHPARDRGHPQQSVARASAGNYTVSPAISSDGASCSTSSTAHPSMPSPLPTERPRARVLTEEELRAVWTTARAGAPPFQSLASLLLLTGARRGEVAALRWQWIGTDYIEWPPEAVKNNRRHRIPYRARGASCARRNPAGFRTRTSSPPPAVAKRPRPRSTAGAKPRPSSTRSAGYRDIRFSISRRINSTGHYQLRTPQVVVEKLLNHVSGGVLSPISQVYNRFEYWDAQVSAVLTYERLLTTL